VNKKKGGEREREREREIYRDTKKIEKSREEEEDNTSSIIERL
jgi:hypothetical protein